MFFFCSSDCSKEQLSIQKIQKSNLLNMTVIDITFSSVDYQIIKSQSQMFGNMTVIVLTCSSVN